VAKDDFPENLATVALPRVVKPTATPDAFVLEVRDGPDKGQRFVLDASRPPRILLGQSPACDFRLSDRQVSRRHAALELREHVVYVVDLESTNGTTVNSVNIGEAYLRGGEVLRLGGTTIQVTPSTVQAPATASTDTRFGRVIGASPEMRRLYPLATRLAQSDVPVLVEGDTGTGKELLAEALHEAGPRAAGPFVVLDCTAVPPNLVEAALFGHEKGAFTGALNTRRGVFEQADGGTLLIDEIGDLALDLQPKLLRAIERAEVKRVGADRSIKVNVRIVSATRRDLDKEVQAGRFRDDLFFRLAVTRIELPPLRRRTQDIATLTWHFWRDLGGPPDGPPADLLAQYEAYAWPGNVRELRNAIARRIALGELASNDGLQGAEEPETEKTPPPSAPAAADDDWAEEILSLDLPLPRARERLVAEFQRRYVERVLARHSGNVSRAAAASGIARRYFQVLKARQRRDEG
jgi:DNA-binding NtrC family response regulator